MSDQGTSGLARALGAPDLYALRLAIRLSASLAHEAHEQLLKSPFGQDHDLTLSFQLLDIHAKIATVEGLISDLSEGDLRILPR